ncbi:hypothetical protein DFJ73DRAFT_861779, partial [Zopfochytrium polystomum]
AAPATSASSAAASAGSTFTPLVTAGGELDEDDAGNGGNVGGIEGGNDGADLDSQVHEYDPSAVAAAAALSSHDDPQQQGPTPEARAAATTETGTDSATVMGGITEDSIASSASAEGSVGVVTPAKRAASGDPEQRGSRRYTAGRCTHGKPKGLCVDCAKDNVGGSSICHHLKRRSQCVQCYDEGTGGSTICKHRKQKYACRQCYDEGASTSTSMCKHRRERTKCKACFDEGSPSSTSVCPHRKQRWNCKFCRESCPRRSIVSARKKASGADLNDTGLESYLSTAAGAAADAGDVATNSVDETEAAAPILTDAAMTAAGFGGDEYEEEEQEESGASFVAITDAPNGAPRHEDDEDDSAAGGTNATGTSGESGGAGGSARTGGRTTSSRNGTTKNCPDLSRNHSFCEAFSHGEGMSWTRLLRLLLRRAAASESPGSPTTVTSAVPIESTSEAVYRTHHELPTHAPLHLPPLSTHLATPTTTPARSRRPKVASYGNETAPSMLFAGPVDEVSIGKPTRRRAQVSSASTSPVMVTPKTTPCAPRSGPPAASAAPAEANARPSVLETDDMETAQIIANLVKAEWRGIA